MACSAGCRRTTKDLLTAHGVTQTVDVGGESSTMLNGRLKLEPATTVMVAPGGNWSRSDCASFSPALSSSLPVLSTIGPAKTKVPVITGLTLPTAPILTGKTVIVLGRDLSGVTSVTVGGLAATFVVNADGTVSVTIPNAAPASSTIVVTGPGGSATSATIAVVQPPRFTASNPTSARPGTAVTFTGTRLGFGSIAAHGHVDRGRGVARGDGDEAVDHGAAAAGRLHRAQQRDVVEDLAAHAGVPAAAGVGRGVDHEQLARHPRRGVAGEEQGGGGDLGRLADAAQRRGQQLVELPRPGDDEQQEGAGRPGPPQQRRAADGMGDTVDGRLDAATGEKIMDLLFGLNRATQTTLVLVTHDKQLAERCDRIIRLEAGRVEAKAEPMPVAEFMNGLASAVRQMAKDKNITLEVQPGTELGVVLAEAAAAGVTVLMGKPYTDHELVGHVARLAGVTLAA